jgi:hypothetical protein
MVEVVDADDLTVGYRIDVAVKRKKDPAKPEDEKDLVWRSLCNRSIRFLTAEDCKPGKANPETFEALLVRAIPDRTRRLQFDSAMAVVASKLTTNTASEETAHVEDRVGEWTGPPMGVDPNSLPINLHKPENASALKLGQVYSLSPGVGAPKNVLETWMIPQLVFGGGYHFGLTPVLRGGVARPLDQQGSIYQRATLQRAALPAPEAGARRFLRHERIEAPVVTTPLDILKRVYDEVSDGLRESAELIIVRSKQDPSGQPGRYVPYDQLHADRNKPVTSSYRVVLPPSVPTVFADRHGVFASVAETNLKPFGSGNRNWMGPPDGLSRVDYDATAGGFPTFGFAETSEGQEEKIEQSSADAIFRPRPTNASAVRREPYYPDPAASYVVIAVRDLAGRLLAGQPLVVPLRPTGVAYPEVRPIALDVVAQKTRSKTATQERVLGLELESGKAARGAAMLRPNAPKPKEVLLDGSETIAAQGQGVPVSRVIVALDPGEKFEIDLWCLPTEDDLARWFDVIEAGALIASVDHKTGETCPDCAGFERRLKALKLTEFDEFIRRLGRSRVDVDRPICSVGQARLRAGAVRGMACLAHRMLLARPVPELAARTTLVATHAIEQPYKAPDLRIEPPGAGSVLPFGGSIAVDRPSTGFFEIRAAGASLVTNAFDDHDRRKRTPDEVARGIWPRSPVTGERLKIKDVYGFDVAPDGTVTLPMEVVMLLRVDDDVAAVTDANADLAWRDLATFRPLDSAPQDGNVARVSSTFTISDTRARVLAVTAVAGSRTGAYFRDGKGDVIADHEPTRDENGAIIASRRATRDSEPRSFVLQSRKEPAKVAPLTILPAFALTRCSPERTEHRLTLKVEREVRLRIRMRRPWFSSGEGERLGIVLWPPDILGRSPAGGAAPVGETSKDATRRRARSARSRVGRDYDVASVETSDIDMRAFADEDLGPGGSFVTRWGNDPVKRGQPSLGWLFPAGLFSDLPGAGVDAHGAPLDASKPVYVPRVSIPLPLEEGARTKERTRIEAALLTYVPKFDLDHETWFCDVPLRLDSAAEPFLRLGLVRYQPCAPPHLRASEPVVEWAQIPECRGVRVAIEDDDPNRVVVDIEGSAGAAAYTTPSGEEAVEIESWTRAPVMKVTVLRRLEHGVEDVAELDPGLEPDGWSLRAERVWTPRTQDEWAKACEVRQPSETRPRPRLAVRPNPVTVPISWTAEFRLADNPREPRTAGTRYAVVIEEVQPMLPATYADEPFDERNRQKELTVSGPRFAAKVELPLQCSNSRARTSPDPSRRSEVHSGNGTHPKLTSRVPPPVQSSVKRRRR